MNAETYEDLKCPYCIAEECSFIGCEHLTEKVEEEIRADEREKVLEVLGLFYGMSETMQKAIIEVMKVTQKEGTHKK